VLDSDGLLRSYSSSVIPGFFFGLEAQAGAIVPAVATKIANRIRLCLMIITLSLLRIS
jgi:hypothetical protein